MAAKVPNKLEKPDSIDAQASMSDIAPRSPDVAETMAGPLRVDVEAP
jgi:hypothetical protein